MTLQQTGGRGLFARQQKKGFCGHNKHTILHSQTLTSNHAQKATFSNLVESEITLLLWEKNEAEYSEGLCLVCIVK